jgi:hypothetical protein
METVERPKARAAFPPFPSRLGIPQKARDSNIPTATTAGSHSGLTVCLSQNRPTNFCGEAHYLILWAGGILICWQLSKRQAPYTVRYTLSQNAKITICVVSNLRTDTEHLKSLVPHGTCRFDSGPPHQFFLTLTRTCPGPFPCPSTAFNRTKAAAWSWETRDSFMLILVPWPPPQAVRTAVFPTLSFQAQMPMILRLTTLHENAPELGKSWASS